MLKLPAAVGERQTFNLKEDAKNPIFAEGSRVTVNEFLETMMSDPGPQSVSWLLVRGRSTSDRSQVTERTLHESNSKHLKAIWQNYHLCLIHWWCDG